MVVIMVSRFIYESAKLEQQSYARDTTMSKAGEYTRERPERSISSGRFYFAM